MSYTFTRDWVGPRVDIWGTLFAACVGAPDLRFLEIGSFEGRSAVWFVDNVLTGPGSRLLCVDPWRNYGDTPGVDMGDVRARFLANVAACKRPWAVTSRIGTAIDACDGMGGYDCIYIDGSHRALDVLSDAAICWSLLKIGGLMLFDDYDWTPATGPATDCPRTAIDAWLTCAGDAVEVLCRDVQVAVRKLR